jgi:hypothetical protein
MTGLAPNGTPDVTVVVPTLGRSSLDTLLDRLSAELPPDAEVIVVDDRPLPCNPLEVDGAVVIRSGGGGPARARNLGWRRAATPWVAFLDDDVLPACGWGAWLAHDLSRARPDVAAVQGNLIVPLPADRRPTDAERGTAGLEGAVFITADMAVRRDALLAVGGFDERFRRAYREDVDLALRLLDRDLRIVAGQRLVEHPPKQGSGWASLPAQAGNSDDRLMSRLHGPGWRTRARAPRGRLRQHVIATVSGGVALTAALSGRRPLAAGAGTLWLALTARFAAERIVPGPRTRDELLSMLATSVLIPPAATAYAIAGWWRYRSTTPWPGSTPAAPILGEPVGSTS